MKLSKALGAILGGFGVGLLYFYPILASKIANIDFDKRAYVVGVVSGIAICTVSDQLLRWVKFGGDER